MTTLTAKTLLRSVLIAFVVVSCSTQKAVTSSSQPAKGQLAQQNVDATIWYNTSAENFYIYHQTYAYAKQKLQERLLLAEGGAPAVVLDIDETVLDNSPFMYQLIEQKIAFTEEMWQGWVNKADAKPLPGVQDFLMFCEANGVQVFYVSNRSESMLEATMENLLKYNLPNVNPENIWLMKDSGDKTERRAYVMRQANVLLFIGDNLRDFDEMFRDRTKNYGKQMVEEQLPRMLPQFILLPNPMYGQWQSIFSYPENATEAEKARLKIEQAQPKDY